jgi:hypothetical protein
MVSNSRLERPVSLAGVAWWKSHVQNKSGSSMPDAPRVERGTEEEPIREKIAPGI